MFRLIACVFISSFFFSSQALSQNKLANEMISTSDGQKFYEIGACYAVAVKAVETGNPVLIDTLKRLMRANPDLSTLKDVAGDIATKKCGSNRTESCTRSLPTGVLAFLLGLDKANKYIQANQLSIKDIQKDIVDSCNKYFRY